MAAFELATAGRVVFGAGVFAQVAEAAAGLGECLLLVTGSASGDAAAGELADDLRKRGRRGARMRVTGEPDVAWIEAGVTIAREEGCDAVVALGGGSVIDAAKAMAGLLANGGELLDYVEVVGRGRTLSVPALPLVAVPTTAGTGAEVTRNAVVTVRSEGVKVSLRSHLLLPRLAFVDPRLTYGMPRPVTASTGLDALTQLIEPLTSCRANPMSDAVAETGLRAARSLFEAWEVGTAESREDMALASLCGGLALASSGLGAVHGFAAVLGGRFPIPHGVCCAALLPHVVEGNLAALAARAPGHPALARYARVAALVTGDASLEAGAPERAGGKLVERLLELTRAMEVKRLGAFGVTAGDVAAVAEQAERASSMKGNPLPLTRDELERILARAL